MQEINFLAEIRESVGKGAARKSRARGYIPAVFYEKNKPSISIELSAKEFENTYRKLKSRNALVNLNIDGKDRKALLRDVQYDPLDGHILHADFYGIAENQEITVSVPVHFVGTAVGIKEGGILQTIIREMDISCIASQIPEAINVDISAMEIGDSIHVSDLDFKGIKILTAPQRTIATMIRPTVIKAAATTVAGEGEEIEGEAEGEEEAVAEGEGTDKSDKETSK